MPNYICTNCQGCQTASCNNCSAFTCNCGGSTQDNGNVGGSNDNTINNCSCNSGCGVCNQNTSVCNCGTCNSCNSCNSCASLNPCSSLNIGNESLLVFIAIVILLITIV
ncbi:MAG: hypothetical protein E7675_03020 [Ruminococcaceae bacterium]|nr:hypothetical protein [Oscillospiraceae bacterium]